MIDAIGEATRLVNVGSTGGLQAVTERRSRRVGGSLKSLSQKSLDAYPGYRVDGGTGLMISPN